MSIVCGVGICVSTVFFAAPASATLPNCSVATLSGLHVSNVAVTSATDVPTAGTIPESCNVQGTVVTQGEGAAPGAALFNLRLPATWNNRFLFLGCGSNCGSLSNISANTTDISEALGLGYAIVNTDTGHTQQGTELTWALLASGVPNEPALIDFFYRAVHQVTVAAKQLVSGYYGSAITYAYFDGCSTGGRQSLMEGARYPEDFDGLVAGAPVMDRSRYPTSAIKQAKAFLPLDAYIPFALLPTLDAAVNANCDTADGVADGLIQNPARCSFDPQALVPAVLTQAQADALALYLSQVTDTQGTPVYPGMPIGHFTTSGFEGRVELDTPAVDPTAAQPWGASGTGPFAWTSGDLAIRYYVERDPTFDVNNDWPQTDAVIDAAAVQLLRQRLGAADADDPQQIAAFLRRGGKLILYHGFSDPTLTPYRTIQLYKALAEREKGYKHLQEQARLFMVPGMGHCNEGGGGPGPTSFDTLMALDKWVSHGIAPEAIIATNNGSGRTMPLCKFPEEASYGGSGDVNQAVHWTCHAHDRRLLQVGPDGILAGVGGDHDADHDDVNHEGDK
jgi:feruloyl esterase